MGMVLCCFGVRDTTAENSNDSDSGNHCFPNFHITFTKHKEILVRSNEVNVIPSTLAQASATQKELILDLSSPDDEDECPTCLEEYDSENPKIIARCSHHFHLSCIYEWMERSTECPFCFRVMEFDETA